MPQLDPNLLAVQRILLIIELLTQGREKRPADQFFVALLRLVHLRELCILSFGHDEANIIRVFWHKVFRQIVRVTLPDIPGYLHVVGSLELDGLDVQTRGDKNRRLAASLGGWHERRQVAFDLLRGGYYGIGGGWVWRGSVGANPHGAHCDQASERNERRDAPSPSTYPGNAFRVFLAVDHRGHLYQI